MSDTTAQITALVEALNAATDGQGLSIDELAARLGWPRDRVNDRLCDLRGKVVNEKIRVKGKAVIKYRLKLRSA